MTPAPAIATLAPQIGKLVRLLSSDKDGEVIAAVRALDRVLKAHKLDFHDLALALCPAGTPVRHRAGDWHDTLAFCAANMDRCAPRERAFSARLPSGAASFHHVSAIGLKRLPIGSRTVRDEHEHARHRHARPSDRRSASACLMWRVPLCGPTKRRGVSQPQADVAYLAT